MAKVQPFLFTVTSSANGDYTGVRLVFKGVQNRQSRISSIPTDGHTKWTCSVAPHGYVNADTMLEILGDLRDHIVEKQVPTPVLLFMDGYKAHYSVAIWDFCKVIPYP